MTPFQELIMSQLDQRGWNKSDLARASSGVISRQTVSLWLRQPLRRMPNESSIQALSDAFRLHPDVLRRAAAASTGVPVAPVAVPTSLDLADVPPDVLILEIGRRIGASATSSNRAGRLAAYRPPRGRQDHPQE